MTENVNKNITTQLVTKLELFFSINENLILSQHLGHCYQKKLKKLFWEEAKRVFSVLGGGGIRTSREKGFPIKLTALRSSKTQYYCDQILSKTDQYT